ncbi:RNA ligase family protein [Anaeropeptidivorans aminofermentans]|jgi:hypothetical protein|uniref:RNA ligase family protein n=1 Tax=Anaeropeptidivorans aminofermentans TaxID=2934315 RepID=UPI0020247E1D|nr:RNA ligase family protein [Anaeropeptidivorans aminofermentans]
MQNELYKYPRTAHIIGSRLQAGDEDLKSISLDILKDKYLVIEEKIDGANCGISFGKGDELLLQSRGHFLTGGYRERHFNMLKTWAMVYREQLFQLLGNRYILYGEWMYAKHTIYYDKLPHYFMEFDVFDKQDNVFLSTYKRQEKLKNYPFIHSVPVLKTGRIKDMEELSGLIQKSLYKSEHWLENLKEICKRNLDFEMVLGQTDRSDLAEGLYIKWEEDSQVKGRYKYVRAEFVAQILSADDHWLERPIIPNGLERGEMEWI